MVATAAAPVNTGKLLVREAGTPPVPVALREAVLDALPDALLGLTLPVDEAVTVPLRALEEARKPLQRPLLHVLYAHCELLEQAALKFPQRGIRPELLAQHWTPATHWLWAAKASHSAPRGRVPGAAVTVDEGRGWKPPALDDADVMVGVDDEAEDEARKPLQKPPLQVLKAHCWLLVQEAWKLPQTGWSMELTA